ncbi:MAG: hypothetical protein HUJ25_01665 [Crocinitomicaceae bacterium]|nr:hypothetical protein [Crocinitomicaceae bacterium]
MRPEEIIHKTVIISPLDWGLGHAARCIPIIRQLKAQECKVIFAGVQLQIDLIHKDFPDLIVELIPGYDIELDSQSSTYWQMLVQFKSMKRRTKQEHVMANELVHKYDADIVISDNRYGFYSADALNIFITHQLNPQIPVFRKSVKRMIENYIAHFNHLWIPDNPENPICGNLLDAEIAIPVHYIGYLSRFEKREVPLAYDILVIVSGPEPERSRFQELVTDILRSEDWKYRVVTPNKSEEDWVVTNPSTEELEQLINASNLIVSRAGYTTIMEFLSLGKSAILIPTDGQYEQIYLAEHIQMPNLKFIKEQDLKEELLNSYPIKNLG